MLNIGTRSRYWQWPFRRTWDQFLRSLLFKNCLLHLRRIRDFSHFRTQLNLDENLVGCRNGGSHRGRGRKDFGFRFSVSEAEILSQKNFLLTEKTIFGRKSSPSDSKRNFHLIEHHRWNSNTLVTVCWNVPLSVCEGWCSLMRELLILEIYWKEKELVFSLESSFL